jgi:F0F1-type ATP synthase assembly protein I
MLASMLDVALDVLDKLADARPGCLAAGLLLIGFGAGILFVCSLAVIW